MMNYRFRGPMPMLLFIAALAATALGCAWVGTSDSVRFNGWINEWEMGRLPPLPAPAGRSQDDSAEEKPAGDGIWESVGNFERDAKRTEPLNRLLEKLKHASTARDLWLNPAYSRQRTAVGLDKLDALTALNQGSSPSTVQAYLAARTLHDQNKPGEEIDKTLGPAASDANLKDNVAYLKAARLYRDEDFEEAAREFNALARKYPQSEKREAALLMAALSIMKTSLAYTPTSGDEAHLHEDGKRERHEVTIDDAWREAVAGFKRVMAEYPRGRYFNDARGWIAYLMLRKDDRAAALVEYYRMLSDQSDGSAQLEAIRSLNMVRHHATDGELSRLEMQLAAEPQVALTYAYYSIYNDSLDQWDLSYPDFEDINDANGVYNAEASSRLHNQKIREWEKNRADTGRQVVYRILTFSRRLMDRYPKLAVGGAFALRAAEASLEFGNNDDAVRFGQRALRSGVQNKERAETLWTIGVAEHRLKHLASARKNLETLIHDYPKSNLTDGARRLVAMVAEDSGDIDGALEQYIALKYNVDIAYFVDTLMTTEQLAGFIDRHPNLAEKNELTYSLALRYLRANRWNDARTTLARVQTVKDPDASMYDYDSDASHFAKAPKEFGGPAIITNEMILLDLQTVGDLERLEKAVSKAPDNESAAEAMYQLASYQYEANSLLFYNPVFWNGERAWNLSYLALENRYRTPHEAERLFAYMQEHDTLARALKIYLKVVDQYPHTHAARDAFYTAAVCHERLSNYNSYWRDLYESGLHAGERFVTYTDVKAKYPNYQLPQGTYDWQPSTRTVNGGPGFAAPPRPLPRPSRLARVKAIAEPLFNRAWVFYEKVRRWITFIFLLFGVGFTWRIAAQNRKLLRPKIVRVRLAAPNRTVDPPWTTLFWKDRWELGLNDRLKQFLSERGMEFWLLARDGGSRPILLRNILSHSFLAGLVISLFWFLHFG